MTTIGGISRPRRNQMLAAASRAAWDVFTESYRAGIREPRPPSVNLADLPRGESWHARHLMTHPSSVTLPTPPLDESASDDGPLGHHWSARFIYELGPGYVDAMSGLVFSGNSVILESGPPLRDLSWVAAIAGSKTRLSRGRHNAKLITGPVFPIGRDPITGYYHWIIDFLPRILHVRRIFPDVTVVAPKIKGFVRQSLELLGVKFAQIDSVIRAENIILAEHTDPNWCHPEDVALLRAWGASESLKTNGNANIYVSRRGFRRTMGNESSLEDALRAQGFLVADGQAFSDFKSQISAFFSAKVIVGAFGAGLANMVWSPAGCHVVAISAAPTRQTRSDDYAGVLEIHKTKLHRNLALSSGHTYFNVTIESQSDAAYGCATEALNKISGLIGF